MFAGVDHGCGVHVPRARVARLRQTEARHPAMTGFAHPSQPAVTIPSREDMGPK